MLIDEDEEQLRLRLDTLIVEHRDLDDAIDAMASGVYVDQLQLKRMKMRKLQLKDTIERTRSLLIPDMGA